MSSSPSVWGVSLDIPQINPQINPQIDPCQSLFFFAIPIALVGQLPPFFWGSPGHHMAMGQNLVPLVNPKIAGKWMFIPLKMVLIGIDP